MRSEGSRREIGVICTEVALPVDEDGQYACAVALLQAMASAKLPRCSCLLGGAATVGQPFVWSARWRVDVQRSIKQGTISAP